MALLRYKHSIRPIVASLAAFAAVLTTSASADAAYKTTVSFTSVKVAGDGDSSSCGDFLPHAFDGRINVDGGDHTFFLPTATVAKTSYYWYVLCDGNTYNFSQDQDAMKADLVKTPVLGTITPDEEPPYNRLERIAPVTGYSMPIRLAAREIDAISDDTVSGQWTLTAPTPGTTKGFAMHMVNKGIDITFNGTISTAAQQV